MSDSGETISSFTQIKYKPTAPVDHITIQLNKDVPRKIDVQEMEGHFLGLMPVEEFFCKFMSDPVPFACPPVDFSNMASQGPEKTMHQSFVSPSLIKHPLTDVGHCSPDQRSREIWSLP